MDQDKPVYLTREGLAKIEAELTDLRTVQWPEVSARMHDAMLHGNASDNTEYDDAKAEAAKIEGRMLQLEDMLRHAKVIDDSRSGSLGKVTLGSRVTVRFPDGGTENYILVGKAEASPREGKISNESPVGQALLGRRIGELVSVMAPGGVTRMTIEKVE